MNEEQKQRVAEFVEVLRTTDKPQTTGYLNVTESACTCGHQPVGMCCLGIATDRVPDITKESRGSQCSQCGGLFTYVVYGGDERRDGSYGCLPPVALEFYGFVHDLPAVKAEDGRETGAHVLNDNYRKPFKVIGDAFARQYLDE
jgi:hypothetical protein